MVFFGLGTLPTLLAMGLFFSQLKDWLQQLWVRRAAGVMLIAFGLWTLPVFSQQLMIGNDHTNHATMNGSDMNPEAADMSSMDEMSPDALMPEMQQSGHQH